MTRSSSLCGLDALVLAVGIPLAVLLTAAPPAEAAPTLGFLETWPDTSRQGWSGGTPSSNPGTGGVGGATDGFLKLSQALSGNFGTRSSGPEYLGDWLAAGITEVRVWLNDVEGDQPFEIHFGLGKPFSNFWQYNVGFLPPLNRWAPFVVDLRDSTKFTHTITMDGQGYAAALQDVQVVHLRHDLAPFGQFPDPIAGELGIDNLLLTNGLVGVGEEALAVARPVELSPPYPNPSRGPVAVTIRSAGGAAVRIEVVDVQGRRVRRAELAPGAEPHIWVWDGTDEAGRPVPAGVFKVRATGPGGGTSRSLVRVR